MALAVSVLSGRFCPLRSFGARACDECALGDHRRDWCAAAAGTLLAQTTEIQFAGFVPGTSREGGAGERRRRRSKGIWIGDAIHEGRRGGRVRPIPICSPRLAVHDLARCRKWAGKAASRARDQTGCRCGGRPRRPAATGYGIFLSIADRADREKRPGLLMLPSARSPGWSHAVQGAAFARTSKTTISPHRFCGTTETVLSCI